MRSLLVFLLLFTDILLAQEPQSENNQTSSSEPMVIKDNSGLSKDEIREVAKERDAKTKEKKKVSIKKVIEAIDNKGKVDISKLQKPWEEMSPTPKNKDWVKTKSGEWFRGKIIAFYDDNLEFDSDEVGDYKFDFKDVREIKSYQILSVNIEDLAIVSGVIRYKDNNITIIQGDTSYTFQKDQIISFAPIGEKEKDRWSGKITLSFDMRQGNKDQFDYTAQANVKRRTAKSKLELDYIGKITRIDGVESANDHRINEKFDYYLSRYFFVTPIFSEYYQNRYKNIDSQYTAGAGIGYSIIRKSYLKWDLSGGPAILYTNYNTVTKSQSKTTKSPSLELSTKYEYKITKITKIKYDYKLTFSDNASGFYKHHIILTLENDILKWLELDITTTWDYIDKPTKNSEGETPLSNDYRLLIGFGIEF